MRLRCGFLLLQAFALPIPGQKLVDVLSGMVLQAGQDISEPSVRIDVIERRALATVNGGPTVKLGGATYFPNVAASWGGTAAKLSPEISAKYG